jgi:hypothetical protein
LSLAGQKVAVGLTQLFESQTPFVHRWPLHGVVHDPQANGFDFRSRHSPKFEQKTVPAAQACDDP